MCDGFRASTEDIQRKFVQTDASTKNFQNERSIDPNIHNNQISGTPTALAEDGFIHVDQLYRKPLASFDPELEKDVKVRHSNTITLFSYQRLTRTEPVFV